MKDFRFSKKPPTPQNKDYNILLQQLIALQTLVFEMDDRIRKLEEQNDNTNT